MEMLSKRVVQRSQSSETFAQPLHSSCRRRPVSRKLLIILDSRLRGNDNIVGFMWLCKGLTASTLMSLSSFARPALYPNFGKFKRLRGVIAESAEFEIDSTGTAQLIYATANVVVNADTDGKFCIGTAAAQNPMSFKNRLGASKNVLITVWYN